MQVIERTEKVKKPGTKSRSEQREATRREIIRATIRSIERVGFADTTLATVAEIAGIAQGSLIFHFRTKDDLLIETLRYVADEYRDAWQRTLLAAPPDPVERLCVLAATDFRRELCTQGKIAVWKSFWAEAKSRPTYQKICGARDDARHAAVTHSVSLLLGSDDKRSAADIAEAIEGLNEGLITNILGGPRMMTRADAIRVAFLNLAALFPAHAEEIEAYRRRMPGAT